MSLKSQSHFISPLTGKEVSKATYYRHVKKAAEYEPNNGSKRNIWPKNIEKKSQSQSQSYDLADEWSKEVGRTSGKIIANRINKSLSQSQSHEKELFLGEKPGEYNQLLKLFRQLFLAASSRGIPKKMVQECERFL